MIATVQLKLLAIFISDDILFYNILALFWFVVYLTFSSVIHIIHYTVKRYVGFRRYT